MNGTQTREVCRLSEYIDVLKEIPRDPITTLFFRGLGREDFPLQPKLFRDERWEQSERELLNGVIVEQPTEFGSDRLAFDKLVRAQHYGVPTRLLDFTTNPLIALYFACENEEHINSIGQVRCLRPDRERVKFFDSDSVSLKSNLANLSKTEKNALTHEDSEVRASLGLEAPTLLCDERLSDGYHEYIQDLNKKPTFRRLAQFIKEEKPYFENRLEPLHLGMAEFCLPKKSNARIAAQSGCFVVFGLDGHIAGSTNGNPAYQQLNCLPDTISLDLSISVPADAKMALLQELEAVGIDGGTAFPELERVAKRISDKYLQ